MCIGEWIVEGWRAEQVCRFMGPIAFQADVLAVSTCARMKLEKGLIGAFQTAKRPSGPSSIAWSPPDSSTSVLTLFNSWQ